ncbi:unnamed protein product [Rhizophagus irregularis]|nr:unnamed protein product [Rhizophagus irregularis]
MAYVLDAKISIKNNQIPFYYRLNIDLRGRTSGIDITNIKIELGEIKSSKVSKAIKKGYRQLLFEVGCAQLRN